MDKDTRQVLIERKYGYKCECEACENPEKFVLRKDLRPHKHGPVVSKEDKKLLICGNGEKALYVFEDLAYTIRKFHKTYPSSYSLDIQDEMRLAYNALLGNFPERYTI